jgi:type VII secretion protein EccB
VQTRRDQVHSYQFFLHRVVSGLVARESDPAELPFRRLGGAALGSVMLAVVALAAVGIIGIVRGGGNTSWRTGQFVVVERESGTRFVYLNGRLHPVLNLASARLILRAPAAVKLVSAKSLIGVPRGARLGIADAPDSLPRAGRLLGGGWSACTAMDTDAAGSRAAGTTLAIARRPVSGVALGDGQALLVRDTIAGRQRLHLVWRGLRYAIDTVEPVLRAFGTGADRAVPVAAAFLDTLPRGTPIAMPRAESMAAPTTAFGDRATPVLTGQVVEAPAGTFYLVRTADLQPITALQKDIVLADAATARAYPGTEPRAVPLSTALVAGAMVGPRPAPDPSDPPDRRPELVTPGPDEFRDGAVCSWFDPGRFAPVVYVGARPGGGGLLDTPRRGDGGKLLADRVLVEPGRAVLVEALSAPDVPRGSLHLVTDQGLRYGLPDDDVAAMLGYPRGRAVRMPATLLDRLPAGAALDPALARVPG